jgi:hypothetical protein
MSDLASLQARLQALLQEIFGSVSPFGETGGFFLPHGSAGVIAVVREGDNTPPFVQVCSPVVTEIPNSPDLLDTLNTINGNMPFGTAYWANNYVWFTQNLIAETLDRPELEEAIKSIGEWADGVDDAFAQRYGGTLPFAPQEPPPGAWNPQTASPVGAAPGPPPAGAVG